MFEMKDIKNIELPPENCKICGTPTNPCDIIFVPPRSRICGRCYAEFYKKEMNRYNAQILNDKGEYHLQFETNSRENFDAMEKLAQKCIDNKPRTNFDRIIESVEALAEFLGKTMMCDDCPIRLQYNTCKSSVSSPCPEIIKQWLQKECEKVANEPKHMGEIIQENIKNLKNIVDNEFKGE